MSASLTLLGDKQVVEMRLVKALGLIMFVGAIVAAKMEHPGCAAAFAVGALVLIAYGQLKSRHDADDRPSISGKPMK